MLTVDYMEQRDALEVKTNPNFNRVLMMTVLKEHIVVLIWQYLRFVAKDIC